MIMTNLCLIIRKSKTSFSTMNMSYFTCLILLKSKGYYYKPFNRKNEEYEIHEENTK